MKPPGNALAPPPLGNLTLRTTAYRDYKAVQPEQFQDVGRNRIALITGSGRGIGRGIAFAFVEAGFAVAITARTDVEVNNTVDDLKTSFPSSKVVGIVADALIHADLERLVREVNAQLGTIDVLICNAGTNTFMPFTMTKPEDWWHSLELNLRSPTELTRIILPQMRQRNSGTIIYTSSRAAIADLPWTSAYGAGKSAISRFAGVLQAELDQTQSIEYGFIENGISLFSIHPGEIETSLHTSAYPERTHKEAPFIIEHMKALEATRPHFDVSLPAWTCIYLASGKANRLRGKYVDCTRDVEEQMALYRQ